MRMWLKLDLVGLFWCFDVFVGCSKGMEGSSTFCNNPLQLMSLINWKELAFIILDFKTYSISSLLGKNKLNVGSLVTLLVIMKQS